MSNEDLIKRLKGMKSRQCYRCEGGGEDRGNSCQKCGGTGRIETHHIDDLLVLLIEHHKTGVHAT